MSTIALSKDGAMDSWGPVRSVEIWFVKLWRGGVSLVDARPVKDSSLLGNAERRNQSSSGEVGCVKVRPGWFSSGFLPLAKAGGKNFKVRWGRVSWVPSRFGMVRFGKDCSRLGNWP